MKWGANVGKSGIYDCLSQFVYAESKKMVDTKNNVYVLIF